MSYRWWALVALPLWKNLTCQVTNAHGRFIDALLDERAQGNWNDSKMEYVFTKRYNTDQSSLAYSLKSLQIVLFEPAIRRKSISILAAKTDSQFALNHPQVRSQPGRVLCTPPNPGIWSRPLSWNGPQDLAVHWKRERKRELVLMAVIFQCEPA